MVVIIIYSLTYVNYDIILTIAEYHMLTRVALECDLRMIGPLTNVTIPNCFNNISHLYVLFTQIAITCL